MKIKKYKVVYKTDERLDNEKPGWIISKEFALHSLQPGGYTAQFDFSDGSYLGTDDVDWEKELKWLEWSGVKDKKGKNIYEGNICIKDNINQSKRDRYVVIFLHGSFYFERNLKDYQSHVPYSNDDEINFGKVMCQISPNSVGKFNQWEIVGNIYENGDLLI